MTSDFGNGNPQALDLFNIEASLYPQDGFTFLEDQTVTDASSKSRASQASFDSALPYFASLSSWPQRTDNADSLDEPPKYYDYRAYGLLPDSARNSSQSVDVETLGTPSSGTMPGVAAPHFWESFGQTGQMMQPMGWVSDVSPHETVRTMASRGNVSDGSSNPFGNVSVGVSGYSQPHLPNVYGTPQREP